MLKDVVRLVAFETMDKGIPIRDVKSSLELSCETEYHPSAPSVEGSKNSIQGIFVLPQVSIEPMEDDGPDAAPTNAAPKRASTGTY